MWLKVKPTDKIEIAAFVVIVELSNGREMTIELIRGPLWPENGSAPLAFVRENQDETIENSEGKFSSIDAMASFYGCIIDHSKTRYSDHN